MNTKAIIGVSILAVVLLVSASLTSVVGYGSVKASQETDYVDIISQACGVSGFKNTTVRLTKERYQNFIDYIESFNSKLNQTKSIEETIQLFKEAVTELGKFGLLPNGMNTTQGQKLILGCFQKNQFIRFIEREKSEFKMNNNSNYFCLIAGHTTNTIAQGPILSAINILTWVLVDLSVFLRYYTPFFLLGLLCVLIDLPLFVISGFGFGTYLSHLNPLCLLSTLGLGMSFDFYPMGYYQETAGGYLFTQGSNGIKNWSGNMYGNLYYPMEIKALGSALTSWPGVLGFTGIKISLPPFNSFYIGYALGVKIDQ